MDNMIKDVERRAMKKWEGKNNMKSIPRLHHLGRESYWEGMSGILDRFEYKDMIDDWWREMLPPREEDQ
jgi:hypothetical protein